LISLRRDTFITSYMQRMPAVTVNCTTQLFYITVPLHWYARRIWWLDTYKIGRKKEGCPEQQAHPSPFFNSVQRAVSSFVQVLSRK